MSLNHELNDVNPYAFDMAFNAAANRVVSQWRHETQGAPPPTEFGLGPEDRTEIDNLKDRGVLAALGRFAVQLKSNPDLLSDVPTAQKEGIVLGLNMVAETLASYIFAQEEPDTI